MLSIQEINLLKSQNEGLKKQNEGLKKQNESLQKENKFLKEQNKVIANELDEYIQKLSKPEFELLLHDDYFKGLNVNQILELAKKSIRLSAENRELEEGMEDLNTELESLREQYHTVLNLAKQNADANEYCLQELEKENKELKKKLGVNNERISKSITRI